MRVIGSAIKRTSCVHIIITVDKTSVCCCVQKCGPLSLTTSTSHTIPILEMQPYSRTNCNYFFFLNYCLFVKQWIQITKKVLLFSCKLQIKPKKSFVLFISKVLCVRNDKENGEVMLLNVCDSEEQYRKENML